MLSVSNITKSYKNIKVVDSLSFSLELGKVTGFVGNNGAGKTTTMNIMLGLKKSNTGGVLYDSEPLNQYADPSKIVGIVSSEDTFSRGSTVNEHLRSLTLLSDVPRERIGRVLEEVELTEKSRTTIKKLSNGMKQKLKIATAILSMPKYLILDEPFNGLDPESTKWLRKFLESYVKGGDRSVFVSSHVLSELAQFIDNLIVIDNGKLIIQDDWQNIVKNHRNPNLEDVFLELISKKNTTQ